MGSSNSTSDDNSNEKLKHSIDIKGKSTVYSSI